ncbi:hypothetical protein As57867_009350, partial [Aphanomyces stellatus]
MLYNLVALSELWPTPTPSRQTLESMFNATFFGIDMSTMVPLYCLASGANSSKESGCDTEPTNPTKFQFRYPVDKYYDQPIEIPTNTNVLLLSGLLDAQIPPKYALYQLDSLVGDNKLLLEFPAGHGVIATACGLSVFGDFVNRGSLQGLDASCVADLKTRFATNPQLDALLWSTKSGDIFDGEFKQPKYESSYNEPSYTWKHVAIAGLCSMLAAYSTTSAVTDVSKLISLLDKGKESSVYGVSYGSYLVERLMQLANPQIKGYILDGVVSQSGSTRKQKLSFADWDVNMNEVGEVFLNQWKTYSGRPRQFTAAMMTATLTDLDKD